MSNDINPLMTAMGVGIVVTVTIVVVAAVFLVARAFVLWYWKLDKIEEHLKEIREALTKGKRD